MPCFLSCTSQKQKTKAFSGDYKGALDSYLKGENRDVEAIALSTCCLLLQRSHFLKLGGFNDSYRGHGCEDFDLVHKLCALYPKYKRQDDYYRDDKQRFPANYKGFRHYFSFYTLENLLTGNFVLHQWHPRPPIAYHKQREANEHLLQTEMRNFDRLYAEDISSVMEGVSPPPDLVDFIKLLMQKQHYSLAHYPGLFCWRKGVKEQGVLLRKVNKFFRNPLTFVRDSKLARLFF